VCAVRGPLGTSSLWAFQEVDRPDLKYKPFAPAIPPSLQGVRGADLFSVIGQRDVLLHHPYDSFEPVLELVRAAAKDPDVLAIKQTLYRVGANAPIVEALAEAAANNKQVAVMLEVKARFDEESNIGWTKALENEGAHVVYGLVGLKTHSKVLLIVRREGGRIRRYVHLGTGNYNAVTTRQYTDLGLLTCREDFGADASVLFNYLTGYSSGQDYRKFLVAPINLRRRFEELVRREIEHQRRGEPAHLIFKFNSLVDKRVIRLLYEASCAGVRVDLLVRGICCLRPGLEGLSENVRVVSIVGRFLEHSRIFYFRNGGQEEVYLGSADLMPRNLDRRVETLFPVEDPALVRRLRDEILATYLADNLKGHLMAADGSYVKLRPEPGTEPLNSQEWLIARAASPAGPPAERAQAVASLPFRRGRRGTQKRKR
jgi:polyphosphate kinase